MKSSHQLLSTLLLAVLPVAQAQTWSECNPIKASCPPNRGLKSSSFSTNFASEKGLPPGWVKEKSAGNINYGPSGAEFVMSKQGESPGLNTDFFFLFGYVEVKMKAAPGVGVISTYVLQSDDLDEIDYEFLGSEAHQVQANYFRKGDDGTYDRGSKHPVEAQGGLHTYAVNWTTSAMTFLIDGAPVRTVNAADAKGKFPQTPMRLKLGIWAGGDASRTKDQITWAGGAIDWSKAPYTVVIDSVKIVNYNPAEQYRYKDNSGSWQSIEIIGGKAIDANAVPDPAPNQGQVNNVVSSSDPASNSASASSASAKPTSPPSSSAPPKVGTPQQSSAAPNATSSRPNTQTSAPAKPVQTGGSSSSLLASTPLIAVCLAAMHFFI